MANETPLQSFFAAIGFKVDEKEFAAALESLQTVRINVLSIAKAAAAGASAVAAAVATAVKVTQGAGDAADKAAQRTGLSTTAIQELGYAAEASDSDVETLQSGLTNLSRVMREAMQGGEEAQRAFRGLGVSFRGADGKARPLEDVLGDIADGLAKTSNKEQRAAVSMEFFGRAGRALVPLLNQGRDGIAALRAEANDLGVVLDDTTVSAASTLGDELGRLKAAGKGLTFAIGGPLLKDATAIARALTKWIVANRGVIASTVVPMARGLGTTLGWVAQVADALVHILLALGDASVRLWNWLEPVRPLVAWLVSAVVVALAPVYALGIAIALVAEDFYRFFTGGKSLVGDLVFAIKEFWSVLFDDPARAEDWWPIRKFKELRDMVRGARDSLGHATFDAGLVHAAAAVFPPLAPIAGAMDLTSAMRGESPGGGVTGGTVNVTVNMGASASAADVATATAAAVEEKQSGWLSDAAALLGL